MGISVESTKWLFSPLFPGQIGIWKCWLLWKEENRSTGEKPSEQGTGTNNKLNPATCDAEIGNRTRAALEGGECSHHCAIPVAGARCSNARKEISRTRKTILHTKIRYQKFNF